MGFAEEISADWEASLAALAWQFDCGVDEAIGEAPVNRYEVVIEKPAPRPAPPAGGAASGRANQAQGAARAFVPEAPPVVQIDPVQLAAAAAQSAPDLAALRDAVERFEHCELKKGARNTVFAEGNPAARVMVLGEAPGREEDIAGRPFTGKTGQLFDAMFAAIGLSRQSPDAEQALYLSNAVFWKPLGHNGPADGDIAMLRPFVERHIALADPDVVVAMGTVALRALNGSGTIKQARGQWLTASGKPCLPMLHPADLLKTPALKREAWADLLTLQAFLRRGADHAG